MVTFNKFSARLPLSYIEEKEFRQKKISENKSILTVLPQPATTTLAPVGIAVFTTGIKAKLLIGNEFAARTTATSNCNVCLKNFGCKIYSAAFIIVPP